MKIKMGIDTVNATNAMTVLFTPPSENIGENIAMNVQIPKENTAAI